jgi:hypothetical protein
MRIALLSFAILSLLRLEADEVPGVTELSQGIKANAFAKLDLKMRTTGLVIGKNIISFDEGMDRWIVRSKENKVFGYYEEKSQKWLMYDLGQELKFSLGGGDYIDLNIYDPDSVFAFAFQDENIIKKKLKSPVPFNPLGKAGEKLFKITVLPSEEKKNEVNPAVRVYREWKVANLEITSLKDAKVKLLFNSSTISRNVELDKVGIARRTFVSYQTLSYFENDESRGVYRIIRLPKNDEEGKTMAAIVDFKEASHEIDLSEKKSFFTNGIDSPIEIGERKPDSLPDAIRLKAIKLPANKTKRAK